MILSAEIVASLEAYLPSRLLKSAKKLGGVQQKRGKNFLKKMIDVDDRIALIE